MKAVEVLRTEHVLVKRLLRCLGALTAEGEIIGSLDEEAATGLLSLFERFVDWSHQDKEELHLFPHMLARATPQEAERLSAVVADHAQERRRLTAMYLHMDGACRGLPTSVDRFVTNSLMYQRIQHKHVEAEEDYVLPLAEVILTDTDDQRILRGFLEIDQRLGGFVAPEREVAVICRRFGIEDEGAKTAPILERPELIGV